MSKPLNFMLMSQKSYMKSRLTTNAPYYFIKVKLINNTQILLKMPHIYNTTKLQYLSYNVFLLDNMEILKINNRTIFVQS